MWAFLAAPFVAGTLILGGQAGHYYDAPIPSRCATSEAWNVDNRDFCKPWFRAHFVGPAQRRPN